MSQNVDGLHLRSGVPRDKLFELHGNCFVETCRGCGARHERDFETGTVGFRATGRRCDRCNLLEEGGEGGQGGRKRRGSGRLYDTVLDWESPLPAAELAQAERDAAEAAVSLCLGTSLQISPANSIPERTVTRKGGAGEGNGPLPPGNLTIVNLQETPKDKLATSVIRARADDVMARVLARVLGATPGEKRLPAWERRDRARVRYEVSRVARRKKKNVAKKGTKTGADSAAADDAERSSRSSSCCRGALEVAVWVASAHGAERCPLPMVSGVGVAATVAATESDKMLAAAKRRAAREALRAAAEADGESGGGDGENDDDDEDSGLRLSSVSLRGPAAPYAARLELEVGGNEHQRGGRLVVVAAVALGLGLGADESRRRAAVDAASFAVEVEVDEGGGGGAGAGPRKKTPLPQKQQQLLQSGSFDVSFVSQVVDYGERVEEARREIEAEEEERVKREEEEKETK